MYDVIYFSHPAKTGGSSVVKGLRTKFPNTPHNHKIFPSYHQFKQQGVKYSLATIRDPYERFISAYNYFKYISDKLSPEELIDKLILKEIRSVLFLPQHLYLKNGLNRVDGIIRMENFDDDWDKIINGELGLNIDPIHHNSTEIKKITSLSSSVADKVYNFYEDDFKILDYSK